MTTTDTTTPTTRPTKPKPYSLVPRSVRWVYKDWVAANRKAKREGRDLSEVMRLLQKAWVEGRVEI